MFYKLCNIGGEMMIIFRGNGKYAYRDPACYFYNGDCHLFFTISEKDDEYMYNRIGHSYSSDLVHWSEPRAITVRDRTLNFSSPGNVIRCGDRYIICLCSYPMPKPFDECAFADDTARLFTIETKDFKSFGLPKLLNPKGDILTKNLGRMIDPYIIKKGKFYYLFFKQNGISLSKSEDFVRWEFVGNAEGGENVCVTEFCGKHLLIHSPENGIAFSTSEDFEQWTEYSYTTLKQSEWEWANGRITAAFACELPEKSSYKYIMFFHGSTDVYPETHGNATLAAAFTNDFKKFSYEI